MNPDHQGLSADEIALLEGDELDDTGAPVMDDVDKAAAARAAGASGAAADDTSVDEEDETAGAANAAPAPVPAPPAPTAPAAPAAPAASAPPAEAAAPAADLDTPDPRPMALADPAKLQVRLTELETKEALAFKQLMDGEIEQEAYDAIKKETKEGEREVITQLTLIQAHKNAVVERNRQTIEELIGTAKASKVIDYMADTKAQKQFDLAITMVAEDPDNAKRSYKWLVNEAHKAVLAIRGINVVAAAAAATTPAAAPPPAASRSVDKSLLPPTLSRVPPAADPNIAGDEFAHLSSLTGADLERAVAKMSPDQQERWLN